MLIAAAIGQIWYALPLIVAVSLVYAATRHELMYPILMRAAKTGAWISGFMLIVLCLLFALNAMV